MGVLRCAGYALPGNRSRSTGSALKRFLGPTGTVLEQGEAKRGSLRSLHIKGQVSPEKTAKRGLPWTRGGETPGWVSPGNPAIIDLKALI